ncbi:copper resistance CopC family protein [Methylomonas fluvii]|uniref:Copper resistance protein C n=1 Tax=Methylomonas fluvii TaxID=1854564 RepID=A0ABR9DKU4_9GAMM|nr:copper resistance protein CopC [Methylomonas fluvii]MBD9363733.1 copper resistance protein CopC [Methylomonas fluvii]
MTHKTAKTIAAALVLMGFSLACLAEGVLLKSEPKDNTEVANFDGNIKLWFSGNVSERSPSVVVVDGQGKRVDNADTRLVLGERHRLTASTRALQPGPHAIRYRVVTEDGLIVSGVLKFTVTDSTEVKP